MCRLLGYCAAGPTSLAGMLGERGLREFTSLSSFHGDGWGMAWYDGSAVRAEKSPLRAIDEPAYDELAHRDLGDVGLVHLRWATPGLPVEAARSALGLPDRRLVDALVQPPLRIRDGLVHIPPPEGGGPAADLPATVVAAVRVLLADLAAAPFASPDADRLRHLGLDLRAIAAAERAGLLLRVSDHIVLAPGADAVARGVLAGLPQPFTAAEARVALQTTRRVAIPLLEFLDRAGVTQRLPDDRRQMLSRPTG